MSMLLNSFVFGAAVLAGGDGGAGVPAYFTAENLASQAAAASFADVLSATETLAAGDYVGFWTFDADNTSTQSHQGRAVVDGVALASQIFTTKQPSAPADKASFGGMFFHTSTGTEKTFAVQAQKSASGTTTVRNARLSMLKLGADDESAVSLTLQNFTDPGNKTAQTAASLAFTPPSAGDYLIICTALITLTNTSNVSMTVELTDGTTSTGAIETRPAGINGERYPVMMILPLSAISGSKTISFKVRQSGTGTTTINTEDIRILALRLDRFANAYTAVLGSANSGTNTTYTAALSTSPTLAAADHLVLASGFYTNTGFGVSSYAEFNDGGAQSQEANRENFHALTKYEMMMSHSIAAYGAGARTFAINRKSESGTTSVSAGSAIAILDLAGL